jgi:hypothetical protein
MNDVFASLNIWFKANKLMLNVHTTNVIKFGTNSKICSNYIVNIGYDNKTVLFYSGKLLSVTQLSIVLSYLSVE